MQKNLVTSGTRVVLITMTMCLALLSISDDCNLIAQAESQTRATSPEPTSSANTQPVSSLATVQKQVEAQIYTETAGTAAIEMLRVPSGKFLMGSPAGTGRSDERPQHEVTVSSFWMGKYEVTQAQWRAVARLPKVAILLEAAPSYFKGDDLPVEFVSWDEAMEFCARLSKASGKTYRLPTEAEWEYACRANTRGDYAGALDEMAWYANNSAKTTHPVGRKKPNGFGLYDMHGNVWEWCLDYWHEDYDGAPSDGRSWKTSGDTSSRVLRGGAWVGDASNCRSAQRVILSPNMRHYYFGFRVAADLLPPSRRPASKVQPK